MGLQKTGWRGIACEKRSFPLDLPGVIDVLVFGMTLTLQAIEQGIQDVFQEHPGIPLFYIESGSRLWGFESPDSDFDVRGFHLQSKDQYFDYRKERDLIEKTDGLFDFVSFDLDKMFGLLAKSNPNCLEWIRGHIVYLDVLPEMQQVRDCVFENYEPAALYHHYVSLVERHVMKLIQKDDQFTYKAALYALRGLLSAEVSARGELPPLLIDALIEASRLDAEILRLIRDCVAIKKQLQEKALVEDQAEARSVIYRAIERVRQLPVSQAGDGQRLQTRLSELSRSIKSGYYCQTSAL